VPQGQLAAERNALNAVVKVIAPSMYAHLPIRTPHPHTAPAHRTRTLAPAAIILRPICLTPTLPPTLTGTLPSFNWASHAVLPASPSSPRPPSSLPQPPSPPPSLTTNGVSRTRRCPANNRACLSTPSAREVCTSKPSVEAMRDSRHAHGARVSSRGGAAWARATYGVWWCSAPRAPDMSHESHEQWQSSASQLKHPLSGPTRATVSLH
jgi:hypothetical protein